VLAHNPDTALYTHHLAPGVMLSGHTRGGVVRIPYYGSPIKSILRIGKDYYAGLNRYGNFYIYTNRGLGTFWMRIRINCRPEISRFNLVALAESAHRDIHRPRPNAAAVRDTPSVESFASRSPLSDKIRLPKFSAIGFRDDPRTAHPLIP
jgi:hypothetical protein